MFAESEDDERIIERVAALDIGKAEARRMVLTLAANRCEAPIFLAWGRCRRAADEVDHIYP